MLRDHLNADELAGYVRRTVSAQELLRSSDHLAECAPCREALQKLQGSLIRAGESELVSYEKLADFLDEKLDPIERKQVADQLSRSPASTAELADLTRFRNEMNALGARSYDSVSSASERKIVAFPQRLARWAMPLAAGLLIAAVGLWIFAHNGAHQSIVTVRDGTHEIVVDANGHVRGLPDMPQELTHSIATAARRGKIEISPIIDSLASNRETLAGVPNESSKFGVVAPVATAVRETTPRFTWTAQPGATRYQIHIVDSGNGEVVETGQSDVGSTEWRPTKPLVPGNIYQWQVEALRGDEVIGRTPKPPEPEARFQILPTKAEQQLAETENSANGSHLVMAVANAKAGLLDDAVRQLRMFASENPDSKIPAELLAQIEMARHSKDKRYSPIATKGAQ